VPGIKRLKTVLRLDRGILGDLREQELPVWTESLLNVPIERKLDIALTLQARANSRLQLTHFEQKAVVSVRDESLSLCAVAPVLSQGRLNCASDDSRVASEQPGQSSHHRNCVVRPP